MVGHCHRHRFVLLLFGLVAWKGNWLYVRLALVVVVIMDNHVFRRRHVSRRVLAVCRVYMCNVTVVVRVQLLLDHARVVTRIRVVVGVEVDDVDVRGVYRLFDNGNFLHMSVHRGSFYSTSVVVFIVVVISNTYTIVVVVIVVV